MPSIPDREKAGCADVFIYYAACVLKSSSRLSSNAHYFFRTTSEGHRSPDDWIQYSKLNDIIDLCCYSCTIHHRLLDLMFFASGFRQSSLRHVRAVRSVPSVQCVHLSTETPATPKKEAVGLKQLADAIAEKTGLSKDQSKEALSALIATISEVCLQA